MVISDERKEKMWKEILNFVKEEAKRPDERTKAELSAELGISIKMVEVRMRRLLQEGKVKKRLINLDGHKTVVYTIIGNDQHK